MVLYVSPYVNHKIKYSKETIWLKLENTSIRIVVVIYMYIWNLIITAPCCFPVNCFVLKVVENSYSKLYQHSNIIESGGVGGGCDVSNWTFLQKYEASLTIYSIFLEIINRFLYQEINPISWYQNFIFWFKEIHWIDFLYQEIGLIVLYHRFFFISRNGFFYIKNQYLISRNTEWIVKRHISAPFYYLFDIFFLIPNIKKHQSEFLI